MLTEANNADIQRFTSQKAVRIRTAEGRSAPSSAQAAAAAALKTRYGVAPSANGDGDGEQT